MSNKIRIKLEELKIALDAYWPDNTVNEMQAELAKYPEWAGAYVLDDFIQHPWKFNNVNLFETVKKISEQDPDYNPAQQWVLVQKQLLGDNFCSLKVLFDNIRTNLAIERMGGQGYLFDVYRKERDFDLRNEFIEQYFKAIIVPGLNWRDWVVYNPDRYKFFVKDKIIDRDLVMLVGNSSVREITENEADRLLSNAVSQKCVLLR